MKKTLVTMLNGALCAGALSLALSSTPAGAQVEVSISPPAWFIATASPVYYDGHASYWYGNRWYYRDGGAWRNYHGEPGYLHDYRGHHEQGRQFYGRAHGGGYRRR